jgi:hypothetical protein
MCKDEERSGPARARRRSLFRAAWDNAADHCLLRKVSFVGDTAMVERCPQDAQHDPDGHRTSARKYS